MSVKESGARSTCGHDADIVDLANSFEFKQCDITDDYNCKTSTFPYAFGQWQIYFAYVNSIVCNQLRMIQLWHQSLVQIESEPTGHCPTAAPKHLWSVCLRDV